MYTINLIILFTITIIQYSHSSCLQKIISQNLSNYDSYWMSASISSDGLNILLCGSVITFYCQINPNNTLTFISSKNIISHLCYLSSNKQIFILKNNEQLHIINTINMTIIKTINKIGNQLFRHANINHNANLIIVSNNKNNVRIININNLTVLFSFQTTNSPSNVCKFRSDDGFAAIASDQFFIYHPNFTLFHSYIKNPASRSSYRYLDLAFCGSNEYPLLLINTNPRKVCQTNNGSEETWNCRNLNQPGGNFAGFDTSDYCKFIVVQGNGQFQVLNQTLSNKQPVDGNIKQNSISISQDGSKIAFIKNNTNIQIYANECCHPSKFNSTCQQLCTCNTNDGTLFHGCSNLTQVYDDFEPVFDSSNLFTGICSYNKSPLLSFVDLEYEQMKNSLIIKIDIIPALMVFDALSMEDLISLFKFDNENISIVQMKYHFSEGRFEVLCQILANINEQLTITFDPMNSTLDHFFSTNRSTLLLNDSQIPYPFVFNEQTTIENQQSHLMTPLNIVAYFAVGLGWVSFISGLFLKRLEGLETIILIQFCWIALLWTDTEFSEPFKLIVPLKFSIGHNIVVFTQTQSPPKRLPFANQNGLSIQHFLNNYNLCLILQIIPLIVFLATFIKMKVLENKQQNKNKENSFGINEKLKKVINIKKFATHCLLYCSLFNLLNFILCFVVFILFGDLMKIDNWIALAFNFVIFIGVLIGLFFVPTSFSTFWEESFRTNKISLHHYFIHVFILSLSLSLLTSIPQLPYISGIPLILMAIYTLTFRPYVRLVDNIRSFVNYLIMSLVIVLVSFLQNYQKTNNSNPQFLIYIFIVLLCSLPLLIILSLVSQFLYWHYDKIIKLRIQKGFSDTEMSRILFDLSTAQVNLKSKSLQEKNVFKMILNQEQTIKNVSNQLKLKKQKMGEEDRQETHVRFNISGTKFQSPIHSYQKQKKLFKNETKQKHKVSKNEDFDYNRMKKQTEKQVEKGNQYAPSIEFKAKQVLIQQNRYVNLRHSIHTVNKIMKNGNTQQQNQFLSIYEDIGPI